MQLITVALNNCEKGEMACAKGNYNHQKSHGISEADLKFIEEHVKEKYQPGISHYRRSHAPHRLYVDPSLTVKDMYNSYKTACISETPPKVAVSKSTFAKQLNCLNISFAKLGHEECDSCLKYKHHECTGNNCVECKAYTDHTGRRNLARKEYSTDKEKAEKKEKDRLYYSLDLQKVRMLPEIPGSKSTVFTQRICAYNETFSPVGKRVGIRMLYCGIKA